jgi:hypothetical protein
MVNITQVFTTYLAQNRGPVLGDPQLRQAPNYGVTASLEGATIFLTLTFRAGCAYCCYEWGCHLNLRETQRWEWLRQVLSAQGLLPAERLELCVVVVVEAGALFFDWSRPDPTRRGRYAVAPSETRQYKVVIHE